MKKYLMTGVAALAFAATFTSCSKAGDLYDEGRVEKEKEQAIVNSYEKAFEAAFGKVGANVDWGFSSRKAFTRAQDQNYPATSGHINANGNEWAASTTGDNPKTYGGWLVPAPLTEGQIERVKAYFQANPNLEYKDPHWRHFFVQQVYKGGDDPKEGGSPENIVSAGNKTTDSNSMTELYVGPNKNEDYKINNFSKGDATPYPNVLNNGQDVNLGDHYSDKILLMVNVDNTSTFTYFNSTTSSAVNNKCALVAASVIDAWAAENGNPGAAVVDEWERSFLGFDLALMEGNQVYAKSQTGEVQVASYQKCAESPNYAWDGEKVIDISGDKTIKKSNGDAIGYIFEHADWYVATDKLNMQQTSQGFTPENANTCTTPVIKEFTYNGTKYQSVVNLRYLQELADNGWVPTNQDGLTNWVKVGKSDGYFTDWIVTLTRGDRIDEKRTPLYRVIAEDLTASQSGDFDFNDVVFDVVSYDQSTNKTTLRLQACGGTLPLMIGSTKGANGVEVHSLYGDNTPDATTGKYKMWNTIKGQNTHEPVDFTINGKYTTPEELLNLRIEVFKENDWMLLTANKGVAACKILVDDRFPIVPERTPIANEQGNFTTYVQGNWKDEDGFWWIQK